MTETGDLSWLRVAFAFSVVLALLAALGWGLKYLSARGISLVGPKGGSRRLKLVENLPLDARRRCVIVRCDEREHLLLLGEQDSIVVDANLPPVQRRDPS